MTPKNRQNGEWRISEAETNCSDYCWRTTCAFCLWIIWFSDTCLSIQNAPLAVHFDHGCTCFCMTSIYRCITKLEILISWDDLCRPSSIVTLCEFYPSFSELLLKSLKANFLPPTEFWHFFFLIFQSQAPFTRYSDKYSSKTKMSQLQLFISYLFISTSTGIRLSHGNKLCASQYYRLNHLVQS